MKVYLEKGEKGQKKNALLKETKVIKQEKSSQPVLKCLNSAYEQIYSGLLRKASGTVRSSTRAGPEACASEAILWEDH